MPGCVIAMARLNRPSIMVYGGTIKPGYSELTGEPLDIVSAFQSYGDGATMLRVCSAVLLTAPRVHFVASCQPCFGQAFVA